MQRQNMDTVRVCPEVLIAAGIPLGSGATLPSATPCHLQGSVPHTPNTFSTEGHPGFACSKMS